MIILAPMQGLTELLFRKAYESVFPGAIDLAVSPFLSLTHGNLKGALCKIEDVLPELNEGSIPVVPQILGKEPKEFVELANRLHEIGYSEVNWNIGCPVRRVAAKHRGSGILPYPDEVREVLDYVVPRMAARLSVKMRLGFYSEREIFDLVPILNDYPLKNVTIHPRTGKQQYGGVVDKDTFAEVLPLINHEVIYNGDICRVEDYREIQRRFPQIKSSMIGRGVLYNPLLPLQIKGVSCSDTKALEFVAVLVCSLLDAPLSEQAKIRKIKEYWCLQFKSLGITEQQRYEVLHAQTLDEVLAALRKFKVEV